MKVTTEYDTNSKEMKHMHDGKEMENVHHINYEKIGSNKDGVAQYEMRVSQMAKDAEHDTMHIEHTWANKEKNEKVVANIIDYLSKYDAPLSKRLDDKQNKDKNEQAKSAK